MQSDILKKIDFVCLETLKGEYSKQTDIYFEVNDIVVSQN